MFRWTVLLFACVASSTAFGASSSGVSRSGDYEAFSKQFCAASRASEHIFITPIAVFEKTSVTCDDGDSMLRKAEPKDDPGHLVFNIDPPSGSKQSFDCDGKADIDMAVVAINCLPVSQETKEHRKE